MSSETIDWKKDDGSKFEKHARESLIDLYPFFLKDICDFWDKEIEGKKVLEIGSGPGLMLEEFEKAKSGLIVAYDLSFDMLSRACQKSFHSDKTLYIQGCAETLPFKTGIFDIVFSRGSIFFWKQKQRCLQNILRILTKGGIALIGGGYSMSAPEEYLSNARSKKGKNIIRMNPDQLLSSVNLDCQKADVISKRGRGFWIRIIK